MYKIRFIVLVLLLFIYGCGKQDGLPIVSAEQDVHYYFPKVSVSVKKIFYENRQSGEDEKWYTDRFISLLKESTYFLDVSEQKSPYHISVKYQQYTYTSWGTKIVSWITPAVLFGGIDLDMGYEFVIQIKHNGKELEKYVYKEDYTGKWGDVPKEGKRFFEKSMKVFLKTLPYKSKMKHIKISKKD